jgi:hypothetical protein
MTSDRLAAHAALARWKLLGALDPFQLVVAHDAEADLQLHLKLANLPFVEESPHLR